MKRIDKDTYYLNIARAVAQRSTCLRRHYGAVIVQNDEIVATGYNGSARGEVNCCDVFAQCPRKNRAHNSGDYSDCPAVHAEQNALLSASRREMIGASLYLCGEECVEDENGEWTYTLIQDASPCPICQRMINNAGIKKIIVF